MRIVSVTSEFSLGQSMLSVDDIVSYAIEQKVDKVIVTDTMNVSAMIPLAEKLQDKLVFGVRLNLVDELLDDKKLPVYQPKVFPLTEKGMQIIYKYLSLSFEKPQFYFVPRLSMDQFNEMMNEAASEGQRHLIFTTGDFNSLLKHPNTKVIRNYFDHSSRFIEKVEIYNAAFNRLNKIADKWASDLGKTCIVTYPSLYKKEDQKAFPIHYSINKNVEFNYLNPFNSFAITWNSSPVGHINYKFASLPFYQWHKQKPKLPVLATDPDQTLRNEVVKGFKTKLYKKVYGFQPSDEDLKSKYIPRLKYELDVIQKLGFASYFLMVWEVTSWSQRQNILTGPGRGSAAGSLISYCLDITDVDPIRAGLMFERFINPSRLDLPDIDLDFMSSRRGEIIDHLVDRYGSENVAGIVNYNSLQSKSALRSACRILGVPEADYSCSKLIPAEFGFVKPLEDARKEVVEIQQFALKYPDVWDIATKLEKKMRTYGTHAAGVIVSDRPLINDTVIEQRSGSRVINWDKENCEKQGLIKLDALGIACLDVIYQAVANIKSTKKIDFDIRSIPLDDKEVLENFSLGVTGGVFQFEGGSVKRLLRDLSQETFLTFDDLVAANALNRPGPIEAGYVKTYVDRKNGAAFDYAHPVLEPILENTYGVTAYQEQLMKMCVDLCGFTNSESDLVRKAVGKKDKAKMALYETQFVEGAIAGQVEVELEDGSVVYLHRNRKYKVRENDNLYTVEEIFSNGFTLNDSL